MKVKLLDAATAAGASNSVVLNAPVSNHTVECTYVDANASISAVTIKLQGSLDDRGVTDGNANWYDLATHTFSAAEITAKKAMFHVTDKPVTRVRLNLSTLTGEGAGDTVTAYYLAAGVR